MERLPVDRAYQGGAWQGNQGEYAMERWPMATATTTGVSVTPVHVTAEKHEAQHLRQGGRVSMSRRIKWLFAAAVALLGAAPASAQYQLGTTNLAAPVHEIPLPVAWGDRDEGFYFSAEAAVMRINSALRGQNVARRGYVDLDGSIRGNPNGGIVDILDGGGNYVTTLWTERGPAGAIYGSQEVALNTDEVNKDQFQPGTRITFGYRMRSGITIEASYMGLTKARSAATSGIVNPSQNAGNDGANAYLYSGFYNFSPYYAGPQREIISDVWLQTLPPNNLGTYQPVNLPADVQNLGGFAVSAYGITNGFELVQISQLLSIHTAELNMRVPVLQVEGTRTYWTGGFRYISTMERFRMVIEDQGFPDALGGPFGGGIIDNEQRNEWSLRYTTKQRNNFYGLQTGVGGEAYLFNGFAVSLDSKIGVLAQANRSSVTLNRLDSVEGLVKRTQNYFNMAGLFQGGAYLWWYAHEGVTFRVGYEYLGILGARRMTDPIDYDLGRLSPTARNSYLSLDGFVMGVSFTF